MTDIAIDDLMLGVGPIDADHRLSVDLWRSARDAAPAAFAAALAAFVDHLADHFAREEELMRAAAYADLPHHAAEHARVVAEARRFAAQVAAGRTMMARAWVNDMVPDWFHRHVIMFDSEVARVVKRAGLD
ncbi:MAG: hemerythrin family protein [Siculibacillus sp.]